MNVASNITWTIEQMNPHNVERENTELRLVLHKEMSTNVKLRVYARIRNRIEIEPCLPSSNWSGIGYSVSTWKSPGKTAVDRIDRIVHCRTITTAREEKKSVAPYCRFFHRCSYCGPSVVVSSAFVPFAVTDSSPSVFWMNWEENRSIRRACNKQHTRFYYVHSFNHK